MECPCCRAFFQKASKFVGCATSLNTHQFCGQLEAPAVCKTELVEVDVSKDVFLVEPLNRLILVYSGLYNLKYILPPLSVHKGVVTKFSPVIT